MLRTPSARTARLLARAVRSRVRDRVQKSRTARLRLDTLEAREQPGNVMSGLAAGAAGLGMLEPLAVMEAVVGPNALTKVSDEPPVSSGVGGQEPLATAEPTAETHEALPAKVTGTSESGLPTTGPNTVEAATLSAPDPSDLSIADPAQFNVPATPPATGGEAGGSGGGSSSAPVSSALAGQSAAQGPAMFVGQANPEGTGGESLAEPAPAGPTAVPTTTVAAATGTSTATSSGGSGRPAEVFVTPPNDKPAVEGPAPTQVRTAAVLTTANPLFAVGTDAGVAGQVKVYDALTQALKYTLSPFPNSFTGGVRVAVADVTGDGTSDVVVGQGPGGSNQVRVYNGATGKALNGALGSFAAFTTAQSNGVWVASGDVTGDGKADLVVGTDGTFAPRAKVFSGANGGLVRTVDPSALGFAGGVRVAAGDLNGDGKDEVIVGSSGAGGPARVGAYDGGNGMALYDYLPFGPSYFGGVHIAAGDVTGDGYSDVIVGQATGGAQVKVFSGNDTGSTWNLDAFPGTTTGVRVGAVDADGDGKLDVLAGRGVGGGEVRAYAAAGGGQVFTLTPFGTTFNNGTFVAGDPRPVAGVSILSGGLPDVSITGHTDGVEGGSFTVTFARTGPTTSSLGFTLSYGGTATGGLGDYNTPLAFSFNVGESSTTATFDMSGFYDDALLEGPETAVISVSPSPGYYDAGSPASVTVALVDDDGELAVLGVEGDCGSDPAVDGPWDGDPFFYQQEKEDETNDTGFYNLGGEDPSNDDFYSNDGVGYADGEPEVCECLVGAGGFGEGEAFNVSREPNPDPTAPSPGTDWAIGALPSLQTDGTDILLRAGGRAAYFDGGGGGYSPRDYSQSTLTENTTTKEFTLVTSAGAQVVFSNFDASLPTYQKGQVKSVTDPDGNALAVTSRATDGKPLDLQRTSTTGGVTTTESFQFAYVGSGTNAGKVASITLRRQVGAGSWATVRTVEFTQYGTGSALGNAGDLQTVVVKDGAGAVLSTAHHRYYSSTGSGGYAGAVKYAVSGAGYERAAAYGASLTPTALTVDQLSDAQLAPYADEYFEYDGVGRVTEHTKQGTGCSACAGGLGTTTFAYTTSPFADGYNAWRTKTVETRADGNTVTAYTNYVGQPILAVYKDTTTSQEWATYRRYDADGRVVLRALPSAVSGYDEASADLLNNQSGNYQYLRDGQGVVQTAAYGTTTTATSSTAGSVDGYLASTALQRGESGTAIPQRAQAYLSRTGGSVTVYPVASATRYRNTNGTGGQTTSYAYTFFTGTIQPEQVTVTLPTVTIAQNGPNTATAAVSVMDDRGRVVWAKDPGGFISYTAYDDVTGGVTKVIQDVDTTQTSTFSNLPSGWTTPSGGGLHLTTTYEVDDLGRVTKETSPAGNVTYIVYNDAAHEVRVYPGWDSTNNVPTGPTQVYRQDWSGGYTEELTMSAAPSVSGGRPTGQESVSGVQTLIRYVVNEAGQDVYADQYVSLSGTSYSQSSASLGTSGTNYHRTQQGYDKLGFPNRVVSPMGTIYRTVYDGQGRVVSEWVGTDDTPTTGFWSPTNTAGTDLVKTAESVYDDMNWDGDGTDAGDIGDGTLSHRFEYPSTTSGETRRTDLSYDWRNRPVATKAGVEASESTSRNRPIGYTEYDNLGQVVASEMYDGDTLSITTDSNTDGVPDRPSSSALRAKATAAYDELGRGYQEKTYSVDPSSGTVSTNALTTNYWFDSRGQEVKTSLPGGLVRKAEADGAGRAKKGYTTDGGGDSGYADADDVTGDAVLTQTEWTYDADGNATLVTVRERFHDEVGTGALGTSSTGVKARVSYSAMYYDKADRLTNSVEVGTNAGSSYTRPGSVPSRSDSVLVTEYGYNAAGWTDTVTDPRALVNKSTYDLAGRTTKTVENYVDGTVADADDKTVEFGYNGTGSMTTFTAKLTGGGQQVTEYVYGVSTSGGLVSNDLVAEVRYPDPSTGSSSSTDKDVYTYNFLGQVKTWTDRNGTVHTYTYDVLGRVTADAVTTLGSGVDGTVRRIETEYDGQGNAFRVTSYDAATAGNVVNQVQRAYNGLGQPITEYQATNGSVNTGTSPKVQYAYSFAPSGSTNHSRITSITYPNGRVVTYNYASGLGDTISRLTSITDGATTLESYEYLGDGTAVKRAHPQPGVDLTYIKLTGESDGAAGDKYTGLDAFGRVIDQRWTTSTPTAKDRRQYGYDRDSNRLYADNMVDTTRSELYAYDGLNQLTSFQRGTLNGTKTGLTGAASRAQSWDFDALGNFDSQTTDGTAQTRSANKQNEITSISAATTPAYDSNGNLTTDETGRTFKYDAWNRLVEVRNSGATLLATYRYDGDGRRVRETRGSTTTDLYYSDQWQVLEERVSGAATASYVWSPVYVDALVARDRDTDANGSLDERLYAVQDANWNVVGMMDTSGAVVERYAYDPFGTFAVLTGSWGSRSSSSYAWTYLHQGGRWDPDGGVYSFRHREFSPTLGRWLQTDPAGFAGGDQNLYGYAANSPAVGLDPLGLTLFPDAPGIGLAIGSLLRPDGQVPRRPEKDVLKKLIETLLKTYPNLGTYGTQWGFVSFGDSEGGGKDLGGWSTQNNCMDYAHWFLGRAQKVKPGDEIPGSLLRTADDVEDWLKGSRFGKPEVYYDAFDPQLKKNVVNEKACKGKAMVAFYLPEEAFRGKAPFNKFQITHVAVRTPGGTWLSKLGAKGPLIWHRGPGQLEGIKGEGGFGRLWRVYCLNK